MISFTKEQKFIVTGASSGIGEGVAILLNELGATVIGIGRSQERLEAMRNKCKYPENMFLENKDLTEDIDTLPAYVKSLKEKYGKFHGMAYCAGIAMVKTLQILDYDEVLRCFKINYFAPLMMTKGIADRRNNVGKGCSFVYLSSVDALATTKGQPAYSGSKAALSATIKSLSHELTPYGMRANCVLPSMIKTPMTAETDKMLGHDLKKYPFGWGDVEDVSNLIVYLLSEKAKFISGQNYVIDTGEVL